MKTFDDPEERHRKRCLAYGQRNAARIRVRRRNQYRLKHGIPLDAPIKKTNKVVYP